MFKLSWHEPAESPHGGYSRQGTRLESLEDVREAVQHGWAAPPHEASPEEAAKTYRPVRRPPMAFLCLLDDGCQDGEWLRLRGDHLAIGRTEGDVLIPHDAMMSSKHAELSRERDQDRYGWYLTDLGSTNGTYLGVLKSVVKHHQEVLIGSRRYRFHAGPQGGAVPSDDNGVPAASSRTTQSWHSIAPTDLAASLVELTPQGEGERFFLGADNLIGTNFRTCKVLLTGDPLVSPEHARLSQDRRGRWRLENTLSLNGIWLRIDRMALETPCQFQLGEQRFYFRVP